jgi:hypothetical protein
VWEFVIFSPIDAAAGDGRVIGQQDDAAAADFITTIGSGCATDPCRSAESMAKAAGGL